MEIDKISDSLKEINGINYYKSNDYFEKLDFLLNLFELLSPDWKDHFLKDTYFLNYFTQNHARVLINRQS